MKYNRKVYVYSDIDDYIQEEYTSVFKETGALLVKGDSTSLRRIMAHKELQLDTETNVTNHYCDRELYVVQLGSIDVTEQHIIDIEGMKPDSVILLLLKTLFESNTVFLAHNAKFEYIILHKFFDIDIRNFKDTMLASRIITSGLELPKGYHSLANLLSKGYGIDMDKGDQTTFDGLKMTPGQLLYAHFDVLYLKRLMTDMQRTLDKWKLNKIFALENKTIRPIGDLTINGILVDQEALAENIVDYTTDAKALKTEMVNTIINENNQVIQAGIKELNIVQGQDEVVINWKSSVQKRKILNRLYPNETIISTAKNSLKKLEKSLENPKYVTMFLNDNTDGLESLLIGRHLQFLKDEEMFIPKGHLNLNVNSNAQLLAVFQLWYPKLGSIGVKVLKKLKHPVVMTYKKYTKAQKLVSSFGEKMYTYIESDGRIHAGFNQLVPSGSRMSSSKPNMQQAPSNEKFRRIYIPQKGWKLVDSDYSSAELYLAAYLSRDVKMLWAIENKLDLHSYSAYQIFGQKWLDAGGEEMPTGKPKTKEANAMRKLSKGCSFSILYGTGVVAFSENAGMILSKGKEVLKAYYETFPKLVAFFKMSGQEALKHNYVREPFFGRVRFFTTPTNGMEVSHNKNAGMNYKPQASNSSIMKYAMCLMKKYIETHDIKHKVRLLLTVHDQQTSEAREDFAVEWGEIQTELMEKAALHAIPEGTLKSETNILDHWTK